MAILLLTALASCGGDPAPSPPPAAERPGEASGEGRPAGSAAGPRIETLATGLEVPWEMAVLPDGRALVTERPGRVRLLSREGRLGPEPVAEVEVSAVGEGGLLGVAVDPDFERNRFVYLYRTVEDGNVVSRRRLVGDRLVEERVIVSGIESAMFHNGGRLRFGPDERLYLATGDALSPDLAQDRSSLNGKFLRLERAQYRGSGGRPEVVSIGHRNPQGFDWRPGDDALVATEHGPDGDDEINVIRPGANYGWPEAQGSEHPAPFTAPVAVYPESVAPAGATFVSRRGSEWSGDLLFGTLVGERIRRLRLDGDRVTVNEALFEAELGRVRTVVEGPEGTLYALTNNRDGRGTPRGSDDRIVRITPPGG